VSLLPSTTEILFALGAGGDVVGVTFECDFPPDARSRPIVSTLALTAGLTPGQIDAEVRSRLAAGEDLYRLDADALGELDPDLVLTQDLCAVCAVDVGNVDAALMYLGCRAEVLTVDPGTLSEVLASILTVGQSTGHAAVVTAAVQAVPGAEDAAIILMLGRKTIQSHAATSPRVRRMDELQTELQDGPCLTAIWEQETVHIPDMATETRWPRFAAAAAQADVGSMLCFQQLFVHGDNLGALNLYAATAGAFTADSETIGLVFATHAAIALAAAQQEHHLSTALANRDIIGQAKGIVMERFHLDATHAFALIARLSQEENIKLHDVAAKIVADVAGSSSP